MGNGFNQQAVNLVDKYGSFDFDKDYDKALNLWKKNKEKISKDIERIGHVDVDSITYGGRKERQGMHLPFLNLVVTYNIDVDNKKGEDKIKNYLRKIGDKFNMYVNKTFDKYYSYKDQPAQPDSRRVKLESTSVKISKIRIKEIIREEIINEFRDIPAQGKMFVRVNDKKEALKYLKKLGVSFTSEEPEVHGVSWSNKNKAVASLDKHILVIYEGRQKQQNRLDEALTSKDFVEIKEIIRAEIAAVFFDLFKKKSAWL